MAQVIILDITEIDFLAHWNCLQDAYGCSGRCSWQLGAFQTALAHVSVSVQSDNFSRSILWRCAHQQMHRLRHDLNGQNLKTGLRGDFHQPFFQSRLNRANPNPFTIARYPNQMVIDDSRTVWAMAGCLWHGPILAKECGSVR